MKFLPSFLSVKWTIGRQIALALGAMGAVTGGITGISVLGSHQAATLVANTFDQGLVATTFARALADDFGRIRADVAQNRNGRSLTVTVLDKSFQADLTAVLAQMPSPAVTAASEDLRDAETDWLARSRRLDPRAAPPASLLTELDEAGKAVDRKIEALVDLVVDIAHGYREAAGQAMVAQSGAALAGGLGAVVAALLCAAYLLRSIRAPIARATAFAREIATGNLKARPPGAGSNEVGDLIRAITAMHVRAQNNVAQQAARQTDLHNQVSEALNGSQEGVVVADADGTIRVANRRAMDFLGIADKHLGPGTTLDEVRRLVGLQDRTRQALLQLPDDEPGPREITIPDGRHILIDRYATSAGGFAGHYTDITSIVNQREDLIVSKSNFDAALTNMNQALCVFDHGYRLKIANGRFYALFGLDPSEATVGTAYPALLDMSIRRGNHPGIDPDRLRRHERFICARKGRTHRSIVFRDGRTLTITQTPIQNGGWLATYEDITEQRQANDRIAHVARHDALTNLPNRAFLLSRLELALVRARGEGVAVLYLDLDQFKQVNDTLGHATGDTLLKMVASRLEALVQGPDMVARLGGDEFAVLQTRVSGREQSATLAARIIETVSAPYLIEGSTLRIGTSIGIAVSPKDGSSTGHLMKNADLALYRAKEEGRNAFRFYEAEMQERLTARLTLEADLRRAVINKEFELHFQPLLDVASMQIGSFEALLRWRHPVNGIISPVVFIPVAEQMEIMSGIGAWVLGEACRQAMRWPRTIRVAVNVSVVQLRDGAFTDVVRKALAASGLAPERLELEITESIFMANNAKAMDSLLAIKGTGVKIAMDDFGTGYSSLSYLRRFAFDKIKIDRAFVSDLVDSDGEHLLRTIVTLGRNFGMRVTAEGVETPRQLKHLADIGCDEVQGYLIGRPIPADMTRATLEQHNGRQGLDELAA